MGERPISHNEQVLEEEACVQINRLFNAAKKRLLPEGITFIRLSFKEEEGFSKVIELFGVETGCPSLAITIRDIDGTEIAKTFLKPKIPILSEPSLKVEVRKSKRKTAEELNLPEALDTVRETILRLPQIK